MQTLSTRAVQFIYLSDYGEPEPIDMTADDMMTDDENELPTETCGLCGGDIDHHTDADGRVYWTHGHNAAPLSDGRCCDACNEHVVAARINMVMIPSDSSLYPQIIPHFLALCKEVVA